MLEFLARNPFILFAGFCCLWPGIIPIAAAYYIGRRGMPLSIRWRGWQQDQEDPADDI